MLKKERCLNYSQCNSISNLQFHEQKELTISKKNKIEKCTTNLFLLTVAKETKKHLFESSLKTLDVEINPIIVIYVEY